MKLKKIIQNDKKKRVTIKRMMINFFLKEIIG
jgi:hypothetical protein